MTDASAGADLVAEDTCGREAPSGGMEQFVASRQEALGQHAVLALEHGIAIHRASLEWVRSAMAALGETSSVP
jgi:hypothetical protein